jgi:aryl-alcohol dehydrogenase
MRIQAAVLDEQDAPARHGDLPVPVRVPGALGHEGTGVVTAVGGALTSVREGDHVVIGRPGSGECDHCLAGEPRYCARLGELLLGGVRPGTGACALRRPDGAGLHGHFFGQSSFGTRALIGPLIALYRQGRVPLERLVSWFTFDRLEEAQEGSYAGGVIKPLVRLPA